MARKTGITAPSLTSSSWNDRVIAARAPTPNVNPNPSLGPIRVDAKNTRVPTAVKVLGRDSTDGLPCDDGTDPDDNPDGVCLEEAALRITKLS